ncbi:hypothetical protein D3C75_842930 [compost metagenome]
MTAGLGADRGEGAHLRAVLLHVLATGAAEHPQGTRDIHVGGQFVDHRLGHVCGGARAVVPVAFQGAGLHLLETERQGAIDRPAFHGLTG